MAISAENIHFPSRTGSPARALGFRLLIALVLVGLVTAIAFADRGGYRDADGSVSLLDCIYYATVSITTTGYGDIVPVSDTARLLTTFLVTPLRVLFLILLVGTTLEFLASATRANLRRRIWRRKLHDHVVICGFGTKGRSALRSLIGTGTSLDQIVVIDERLEAIELATREGVTGVLGSAARRDVLTEAAAPDAAALIVATDRDDTSVLVTLTARELAPNATITAAAREEDNVPLLRHSGADTVVTSASAAGRLLGLGTTSPEVVETLEDLLSSGSGIDLVAETVGAEEAGPIGEADRRCGGPVLMAYREGRSLRRGDSELTEVKPGDTVVHVHCRGAR
ncbi:MAG TPA: potassium channel family protein, partial [Thermoleophilaceae bacterium]|nr:potassium channel family protein [Thermoleophilaceae bacterium]